MTHCLIQPAQLFRASNLIYLNGLNANSIPSSGTLIFSAAKCNEFDVLAHIKLGFDTQSHKYWPIVEVQGANKTNTNID